MKLRSILQLPSRILGRNNNPEQASGMCVTRPKSQRTFPNELRYALWLAGPEMDEMSETEIDGLLNLLDENMSMVPAGATQLKATGFEAPQLHMAGDLDAFTQEVFVETMYIDRYAVSNHEYLEFVKGGGYDQMELWPQDIWPSVLQFVDRTGIPGPKYWSQGRPPKERMAHPVTGICWYEASAYAKWCGKRLPSTAEWQWAATWGIPGDTIQSIQKYPWGGTFDPQKANTWMTGFRDTTTVDQYYEGATSNGVFQLVGNVWEWINTRFVHHDDTSPCFAEIRGGAFDSYFESQVTTDFRSGVPLLHRAPNVGFRCCLSHDQIATEQQR